MTALTVVLLVAVLLTLAAHLGDLLVHDDPRGSVHYQPPASHHADAPRL